MLDFNGEWVDRILQYQGTVYPEDIDEDSYEEGYQSEKPEVSVLVGLEGGPEDGRVSVMPGYAFTFITERGHVYE